MLKPPQLVNSRESGKWVKNKCSGIDDSSDSLPRAMLPPAQLDSVC